MKDMTIRNIDRRKILSTFSRTINVDIKDTILGNNKYTKIILSKETYFPSFEIQSISFENSGYAYAKDLHTIMQDIKRCVKIFDGFGKMGSKKEFLDIENKHNKKIENLHGIKLNTKYKNNESTHNCLTVQFLKIRIEGGFVEGVVYHNENTIDSHVKHKVSLEEFKEKFPIEIA